VLTKKVEGQLGKKIARKSRNNLIARGETGPVKIFGRLTHHEIDPDLSPLVVCGTSKYLYGPGKEEAHAGTHSPTTPD